MSWGGGGRLHSIWLASVPRKGILHKKNGASNRGPLWVKPTYHKEVLKGWLIRASKVLCWIRPRKVYLIHPPIPCEGQQLDAPHGKPQG